MTALPKFAPEEANALAIANKINAMDKEDLDNLDAWQDLQDLSSDTIFEAIDADPNSVVVDNTGSFEAVASVYVTLVYGTSRDAASMSDEYLATIGGTFDKTSVKITSVHVDTSPFYK